MLRCRFALLGLALSCATTSHDALPNDRVERSTLHYTDGAAFDLQHQNAFPRMFGSLRPHEISDGSLTGHVCGVGVQLDARWLDETLTLSGFGDIQWQVSPHNEGPMSLTLGVHELAPGRREISGKFGGHVYPDAASPIVDLDVSADHLEGRVQDRRFSLTAHGDYLVGRVRQSDGASQTDTPFAIYGRSVLSTMAPADEGFALVALLACSGLTIDFEDAEVPGFALAKPERPQPILEVDKPGEEDVVDGGADAAADTGQVVAAARSIEPANVEATIKALRQYNGNATTVYLPKDPTEEMRALATSLVSIFRDAGFSVEQQEWKLNSCQRHKCDLAVIGGQPATPVQLDVGLRLMMTKLRVYVCQRASADADRFGVLVLPPHR
ncbi:MAG TPA: hypothetical protein VGL86_29255 [Polyangia bacterium]|jgi:hypothetical protein